MYTLAFSPDGKLLAGEAWDAQPRSIKVWDLKSGEVTATLDAGVGQVWSLACSPDGKQLLVGGNTGVEVWDLAAEKIVQVFQGGHVWQLGVSPDGKKVAYCDPVPKTVRVFNPESGEQLGTLEGSPRSSGPRPSARTAVLATGSDTELLLWSADKLELVKKIGSPAGWLEFDPDGKSLLTAKHDQNGPDRNHVVTRWDLKTFEGKPLPSLSNLSGWPIYHLSLDGKTLYSMVVYGRDIEQYVRAYDAATGRSCSQQGHRNRCGCRQPGRQATGVREP
jgi:WD40 repeat protein